MLTSRSAEIVPCRSSFIITVDPTQERLEAPRHEAATERFADLRVVHSEPGYPESAPAHHRFSEWIREFLIAVPTRIAAVENWQAYVKRVIGEERALARVLTVSPIAVYVANVFMYRTKFRLADWSEGFEGPRFPLKRTEPWKS